MSAVTLEGVVFRYGTTRVLGGVDLELGPAERVAILGDNGAGKTTLLRMLAGLLRPASGTVRVLGGSPRTAGIRRRIGYLGHVPFLYPRLTAAENVRFWGRMYDTADLDRRGPELLDIVGVDPTDRRASAEYSQGMRRRIGLVCALVHSPDLVLCDEPFAGLDASGAHVVGELLGRAEHALVLATHEADRAEAVVHRFCTVAGGRIHEGRPR